MLTGVETPFSLPLAKAGGWRPAGAGAGGGRCRSVAHFTPRVTVHSATPPPAGAAC